MTAIRFHLKKLLFLKAIHSSMTPTKSIQFVKTLFASDYSWPSSSSPARLVTRNLNFLYHPSPWRVSWDREITALYSNIFPSGRANYGEYGYDFRQASPWNKKEDESYEKHFTIRKFQRKIWKNSQQLCIEPIFIHSRWAIKDKKLWSKENIGTRKAKREPTCLVKLNTSGNKVERAVENITTTEMHVPLRRRKNW